MSDDDTQLHDCDLCGSSNAAEIEVARRYSGGSPLHVCKDCGFVYVRLRRSASSIADDWSDDIYQKGYTARIPAVHARQTYVADFIDSSIDLKGKTVCDIGAGEGQFLEIIEREYGAKAFAIEPSAANCKMMDDAGLETFCGTIEDYQASGQASERRFDVATVVWTMENCQSCRTMMDAAYDALVPGGHVVVATGSRILVPFKKPLQYYIGPDRNLDTHCFRASANTLRGLFAVSGFVTTHINRYIDTDYLVAIGEKTDKSAEIEWEKDTFEEIVDFFNRWDEDTQRFYKDS